jgi:hypothetical protein
MPSHLAYFCEFFVHFSVPSSIWIRLSTSSTSVTVLQRLASSRAFTRSDVPLHIVAIPQPHVQVIVFIASITRAIYDRLSSTRHMRHDLLRSCIDVVCDSDTWRAIFSPVIPHSILEHNARYVRLTITGYDLLRRQFFTHGQISLIDTWKGSPIVTPTHHVLE